MFSNQKLVCFQTTKKFYLGSNSVQQTWICFKFHYEFYIPYTKLNKKQTNTKTFFTQLYIYIEQLNCNLRKRVPSEVYEMQWHW